MEERRKAFMKNVTLAQAKDAMGLFRATEEILRLAQLRHPEVHFVPTQVSNLEKFAAEFQHYLRHEQKIKADGALLLNKLRVLKDKPVPKKPQVDTKSAQHHQENVKNFLAGKQIVGQCTVVDKTFSRAAEVPDPAMIRTPETLKKAVKALREYFDKTKEGYVEQDPVTKKFDEHYLYLQTRLRACRYDYQMQKLVDKYYAKALMANVQSAVLAGDRKEFDTVWGECCRAFQETKTGNVTRVCVYRLLWNYLDYGIADLRSVLGSEGVSNAQKFGANLETLAGIVEQLVNCQDVQTAEEDRYVRKLLARLGAKLA